MNDQLTPVVRMLPAEARADGALVEELTDLVNRVYATAEEGLWRDDATRTTTDEMAGLVGDGEIAVAKLDEAIVGSVRIQRLEDAGEFGMLVADPDHRGIGTGRKLVEFAERLTRERGQSTIPARTARAPDLDASEQGVPAELVHPDRLPGRTQGDH